MDEPIFSNEIDDLPPPEEIPAIKGRRVFKELKVPKEIQKELDRSREMLEGDFRKWLIKNKPKDSVMVPIETSTATGVPDIYSCYDGCQQWIECKIAMSKPARIRGTQFIFFAKLAQAGGKGKLVVQRLENRTYKPTSIWIYDSEDIIYTPLDMYKKTGQELILPTSLQPRYKWTYKSDREKNIDDLYIHLLLDSNRFA